MGLGVFVRCTAGVWLTALFVALPTFARAQATTAPSSAPPPATQPADPVEAAIRDALPRLAKRETGLEAVAKLQALRDEKVLRLFEHVRDKSVFIWNDQYVLVRTKADDKNTLEIFDLFTPSDEQGAWQGQPLATVPSDSLPAGKFQLETAKLVRTQVLDSLRVLGLKINDPKVRRKAARALGLYHQTDALAELKAVAENDADKYVRREAASSIALITATSIDTSVTADQKLSALKELSELQPLFAVDQLKEAAAKPNLSPELSNAFAGAIKSIQRHGSIAAWMQNIFSGLSLGSIYVLLALGLAITFGLMGVINMAHGEMLMIGGVTTWACCEYIGKALPPAWYDWYYVIAFPLSFLVAGFVGLLIETTIVRHLYKRPLDSMLATIGVSYVLIQSVRLWKGDNLGLRAPSWASGNIEIFQDVILNYNRLFVLGLTAFCILSIVLLFRFTRLGLMIRATVQNRQMAQALGVNTRMVDMFTFAFGAGLAGVAGWGIMLISSQASPEMGTTYIVKTFLTVVVGGVGKLAGVIASGLGLGFIEKLLEPIIIIKSPIHLFNTTWAQVSALIVVILFMQRRPAGLFPDKGRMADQATAGSAPILSQTSRKTDLLLGAGLLLGGLVVIPLLYGTALLSPEWINKIGYILTFAICAIGLDLIWGYIGVLSLCQFLFFSLGGYVMGFYLINYGPHTKGVPDCLFYVMSAVTDQKSPWFLPIFRSFPLTALLGILLPGALALLIGVTTFRSRVKGVYFSILTQAITVAAVLVFQDNDLKLGGTNGLTNFTHILGHPIVGAPLPVRGESEPWTAFVARYFPIAMGQTRFWLYVASLVTLVLALAATKALISSGFGRVLVAIRDDETRLRFVGYQTWAYKTAAFVLAAALGGIGGMLYVPQMGIINPSMLAAPASILVVAWVAIGGRGTLWGAILGTISVSLLYQSLTSGSPDWFRDFCRSIDFASSEWVPDGSWLAKVWSPDFWLIVLGSLFILVPLLLPGGLMSLPAIFSKILQSKSNLANDFQIKDVKTEAEAPAVGGH